MTEPRWQAVAALVDPVRRALYDYVRRQDHPVTREEAAGAQAISRNLAAFHLDKLVETRLLRARYEAPANEPRGRGRTPKVYEPAADGLTLAIPQRQYELAGEILADAVATEPTNARDAAHRYAFDHGRRIGQRSLGVLAEDVLAEMGFEPHSDGSGTLSLSNCPFHALAVRQPELICGLNHSFLSGVVAGLGAGHLTARLARRPGVCCVVISAS